MAGGQGVGVGFGFGFGFGGEQGWLALTRTKKRRLMERKRAADEDFLESINSLINFTKPITNDIVLVLNWLLNQ